MKSTPATASRGVLGDGDAGAGAPGDVLGEVDDVLGRVQLGGPARRTSLPISAPMTSSERPMLNRQSPHEGVGDLVIGLAAGFVHGEEVGEHLGGVPFVGQPVVDRARRRGRRVPRRRPGRCRGTRSRRTSGPGPRRCRRSIPCARAGSRTGRGRSRARPDRRRRPRTRERVRVEVFSKISAISLPASCWVSVPAYLASLSASASLSRKRSSRGSKSISLRKLRFFRLNDMAGSPVGSERGVALRSGRSCSGRRRGPCRARIPRW